MKHVLVFTALVAHLTLTTVLAQEKGDFEQDHKEYSGLTKQQADEILNELKAIRQLLERLPASGPSVPSIMPSVQSGKLRMDRGFQFGSSNAPVTLVEFTDYQCPFCRQFHDTTFAQLRRDYVDSGRLRIVIRDFPLVDIHPDAMRAAEAAHCAGDQGQFLAMHDLLFTNPKNLAEAGLVAYAEFLRLDVAAFRVCLQSERHKVEIQMDLKDAFALQLNGTPSFLIGRVTGTELSGTIIVGAQALSVFEQRIKDAEAMR